MKLIPKEVNSLAELDPKTKYLQEFLGVEEQPSAPPLIRPDFPEGFVPREGDSLEAYEPTLRDNARNKTSTALQGVGASRNLADQTSKGLWGDESSMGLLDFTPAMIAPNIQEGKRELARGYNTGDPVAMGMGALNLGLSVAEAVPGGKLVSKGITKATDKLMEGYDPSTVRMFFGPTSPKANLSALEEAKQMVDQGGYNDDEIWTRTGWWDSPNGWRFEVSDDQLEIHPDLLKGFNLETLNSGNVNRGSLLDRFDHPEFEDHLPINPTSSDYLANAKLTVGKKSPSSGGFHPDTGDISVYTASDDGLKGVLLHELQHLEQASSKADGALVGTGANPAAIVEDLKKTFNALPRDSLEYLAQRKLNDRDIQFFEDQRSVLKKKLAANPSYKYGPFEDTLEDFSDQLVYLKKQRQNLKKSYAKDTSPEFQEALEDFHKLSGGFSADLTKSKDGNFYPKVLSDPKLSEYNLSAFKLYERDKGEIEARLTAARKDLTAAERAARHPKEDLENPEDYGIAPGEIKRALNKLNSSWDNVQYGSKYAEGGVVVNPENNVVPDGALPKEVRDDIDIKVSEGEYVIPANVVRFLGLEKIEKLVDQAKARLAQLAENGRIGGSGGPTDGELPFSVDELQVSEDAPTGDIPADVPMMATGGLVTQPEILPISTLPNWMTAKNPSSAFANRGGKEIENDPLSGLAGNVDQWSVKNFEQYTDPTNKIPNALANKAISSLPMGNLAMGIRQNYLSKAVPENVSKMLETNMDLQGNTLSAEQVEKLKGVQANLDSVQTGGFSISGVAKDLAERAGLIRKPAKVTAPAKAKAVDTGGLISRPTKTPDAPAKEDTSKGGGGSGPDKASSGPSRTKDEEKDNKK